MTPVGEEDRLGLLYPISAEGGEFGGGEDPYAEAGLDQAEDVVVEGVDADMLFIAEQGGLLLRIAEGGIFYRAGKERGIMDL